MNHPVDINVILFEALGALTASTCSTSDAIRFTPSRMTRSIAGRWRRWDTSSEELGGALDAGQRILNLMREAGRREPKYWGPSTACSALF